MDDSVLLVVALAIMVQPIIGMVLAGLDEFSRSRPLSFNDSGVVAFIKALGLWGLILMIADVIGIAIVAWQNWRGKDARLPEWALLVICSAVTFVASAIAFTKLKRRFNALSMHQTKLVDALIQIQKDLVEQRQRLVDDPDSVRSTAGQIIERLIGFDVFDCEQTIITRVLAVKQKGYIQWQGKWPITTEIFLVFLSVMEQLPGYRLKRNLSIPAAFHRLDDGLIRLIGYVTKKIDAINSGINGTNSSQ